MPLYTVSNGSVVLEYYKLDLLRAIHDKEFKWDKVQIEEIIKLRIGQSLIINKLTITRVE